MTKRVYVDITSRPKASCPHKVHERSSPSKTYYLISIKLYSTTSRSNLGGPVPQRARLEIHFPPFIFREVSLTGVGAVLVPLVHSHVYF